jgi:hypothetical protein
MDLDDAAEIVYGGRMRRPVRPHTPGAAMVTNEIDDCCWIDEPCEEHAEMDDYSDPDARLQGVFDGMWPMLLRYIEGDAGDIELAARLEGYFRRLRDAKDPAYERGYADGFFDGSGGREPRTVPEKGWPTIHSTGDGGYVWTHCPDCGPDVETDEDGCCKTCGADAVHYGVGPSERERPFRCAQCGWSGLEPSVARVNQAHGFVLRDFCPDCEHPVYRENARRQSVCRIDTPSN